MKITLFQTHFYFCGRRVDQPVGKPPLQRPGGFSKRPLSGLHRLQRPREVPSCHRISAEAWLFRHSFITFISGHLITLTFSFLRMWWWWWDAFSLLPKILIVLFMHHFWRHGCHRSCLWPRSYTII